MAVKSAEQYIEVHKKWQEELKALREMLLSTELEETIKWGAPTYTVSGKNVIGLGAFKNHCALWFFNGALLKANTALLQNAQEGKTKALRQIRFAKGEEIKTEVLIKYVGEAIANQKLGREIKPEKQKLVVPPELKAALENDKELKTSFSQLTQGKQREYSEYILEAKREATRQNRLEKITPMIKEGIGLNDKYKNC
ncbi:YdeI family protein [Zunongwangia sp. H14]|uniref:YdeI/OmpD-associated family protein n=1 Tax=Zunongwangia sp. H14 TaxID=3240792 RepID=UPI003561B0E8